MNRSDARSKELVLGAIMIFGVVVEEKVKGFGTVAVVESLAGLKPFGVVC